MSVTVVEEAGARVIQLDVGSAEANAAAARAEAAARAVETVVATNDGIMAAVLRDPESETKAELGAAIEQGAGAAAGDPDTGLGAFLTRMARAMTPGAQVGTHPAFVRQTPALLTLAQTGLPTIYWPHLVNVEHIPGALGKWYLFYSTDHDAPGSGAGFDGKGGIGMAYADRLIGPWTVHRVGGIPVVYQDLTTGDQTETPSVIWNEATSLFHIYYQQESTGYNQSTLLMTSPSGLLNDPANVRVGVVIAGTDRRPGDGHEGYARVLRVGGLWVALHLNGGGDYGSSSVSYSNNGIHWVTSPVRLFRKDAVDSDFGDSQVGRGAPFVWRGEWWILTGYTAYVSGSSQASSSSAVALVSRDMQRIGPTIPTAPKLSGETLTGGVSAVVEEDGALWGAYVSGGSGGVIRLMKAEV